MTRPSGNIFVNPLFFEALSGEFAPPSDEQGRAHNLGNLAIATYMKGDQKVVNHFPIPGFTDTSYIEYTPSWAPNVKSEIIGYLSDTSEKMLLKCIQLTNTRGEELLISNRFSGLSRNGKTIMHVNGSKINFNLALDLGDQLDTAKSKVKTLAQNFFDLEASR